MRERGLDCRNCTTYQKAVHGYERDSKNYSWQIGDYQFKRCPSRLIENSAYDYVEFYCMYKSGYFSKDFEFTAKCIRIFDYIEKLIGMRDGQRQ